MDILNCYFGTLGDCLAMVTGAWYIKPCFPYARRNYLCSSAYGRSCRGRSPIAASSTVRLLNEFLAKGAVCPEGPSRTRGDAQVLGTPLPSRSTSLLVKKGYGTSTDQRYPILVPAQASAKDPHLGDTSGFRWLGGHESSSCPPPSLGQSLNSSD